MKTIFKKLNHYFCAQWQIAVLDLDAGRWITSPINKNISYLKAENAGGRHILMQPLSQIAPYYIMVDDLSITNIHRHHKFHNGTWKPGRMAVETSPDNYQVWIHSDRPLSLDEKRFWLKKLCNDPGADPNNRWGRCPGFRNRKQKYRTPDNCYPLSKLIWIDWKYKASIPQSGFHNTSVKTINCNTTNSLSPQPLWGDVCHYKSISRFQYEKYGESETDFSYALALARRGYSQTTIEDRLLSERTNWENHRGCKRKKTYIMRTIRKAIDIVRNS